MYIFIYICLCVCVCVFAHMRIYTVIELTTNQLWGSSLEKTESHFPRVPLMWFCWCLFLWDVNIHLAATASSDVMRSYFHLVPLVPLWVSPEAVESPSPQSAEDSTTPLSLSSHPHSDSLLCCCTFTGVGRFPVISFTHVCSNHVALSLADKEATQLHSSLSLPGRNDVFSSRSLTNIKRPWSERASGIYTVMCGPKCWWWSWNFIQLFISNIPW